MKTVDVREAFSRVRVAVLSSMLLLVGSACNVQPEEIPATPENFRQSAIDFLAIESNLNAVCSEADTVFREWAAHAHSSENSGAFSIHRVNTPVIDTLGSTVSFLHASDPMPDRIRIRRGGHDNSIFIFIFNPSKPMTNDVGHLRLRQVADHVYVTE